MSTISSASSAHSIKRSRSTPVPMPSSSHRTRDLPCTRCRSRRDGRRTTPAQPQRRIVALHAHFQPGEEVRHAEAARIMKVQVDGATTASGRVPQRPSASRWRRRPRHRVVSEMRLSVKWWARRVQRLLDRRDTSRSECRRQNCSRRRRLMSRSPIWSDCFRECRGGCFPSRCRDVCGFGCAAEKGSDAPRKRFAEFDPVAVLERPLEPRR